jgi:hypothetical protein
MERSDVKELYFITPIANVPSIRIYGILSHNLSSKVPHQSIAMSEIQDKRKNKQVPGAGMLHDYVNLYFDAHNPMLSKVRKMNDQICVLRVDKTVLDLPDVVIADRNAAKDYVRFYPTIDGLASLDKNRVFARYWTNARDQYEAWDLRAVKCAEVLVPDRVEPKYILGAYVANGAALDVFNQLRIRLSVSIKSDIFF